MFSELFTIVGAAGLESIFLHKPENDINEGTNSRSSHQRCSVKKSVLRNSAKFTGKDLCKSLFFNKVATLLKNRLWHRCFPVIFAKFLRTLYFYRTSPVAASAVCSFLLLLTCFS